MPLPDVRGRRILVRKPQCINQRADAIPCGTCTKDHMAYGYTLEAEYSDGYIHSEQKLGDVSPYAIGRNVFNDIIERRPNADHGRMVRFSCIGQYKRYDIDWRLFPMNAKPIYYRHMERQLNQNGDWIGDPYATAHFFGYEYHDQSGQKVKEILELA
jgi:hypothetical protein